MKTIAIIGGGITGTATAYYLQKKLKSSGEQANVILIEAEQELGGKIRSVHDGEFIMESGADSIVARKLNVDAFIAELGLQDELVYNATGISYIYRDGELKAIPKDAVFGIPMSVQSLAESELVSAQGKVDALKDLYTPNTTFTVEDSIGLFLEHFLGKELVEKQISPVLSGVYSGRLNDLTIKSTLPYLLEYKNKYGSIIQGLSEHKAQFQKAGDKKFFSFKKGLSSLIDAMEQKLDNVQILKGVRVDKLVKESEGYILNMSNGEQLEADAVVLSVLHTSAQQMLGDAAMDTSFDQMKNSSLISIYVAYNIPDHELPNDGTGFITDEHSDLSCNACTWTSRKWDHTSANRNLLVRLFYKSTAPIYEELIHMTDQEKLKVACKDIALSLNITDEPVSMEVTSWHQTMPNYHLKHPELVKSLEKHLADHYPNLWLAGCSYYGVGIPDCIANGEHTADEVLAKLHK